MSRVALLPFVRRVLRSLVDLPPMTSPTSTVPARGEPLFDLIGHCSPDSGMLRSAIGQVVEKAATVRVNDDAGLAAVRVPGAIWLVNRVLDGSFASEDGLGLIEATVRSRAEGAGPQVLLVSNYPDAQADAERRGALPGFGKKTLYAEATKAALRRAVERATAAAAASAH